MESALIDGNMGRTAFYTPSQAVFGSQPRMNEAPVIGSGFQRLRCVVDVARLAAMRAATAETNPSLLRDVPEIFIVPV